MEDNLKNLEEKAEKVEEISYKLSDKEKEEFLEEKLRYEAIQNEKEI
ncbi:MAG: hypothetical protein AB1414_01210 [bacterium]